MPDRLLCRYARLVLVLATATGCSYLTGQPMFDAPDAGGGLRVLGSTPASDAAGVLRNSPVIVQFNHFVDPTTITTSSVTLSTSAGSVEIRMRVDLPDQTLIVEPLATLAPDMRHELRLAQTVASLAGQAMGNPVSIVFTTGQTLGGELPPVPQLGLGSDIQPILSGTENPANACTQVGCHDAVAAQAGLVLTANSALTQLVNHPSTQQPQSMRVLPGDPAASYLLRKVVGTPDIRGSVMPIGGRLTPEQIRRISDWILGGAAP